MDCKQFCFRKDGYFYYYYFLCDSIIRLLYCTVIVEQNFSYHEFKYAMFRKKLKLRIAKEFRKITINMKNR